MDIRALFSWLVTSSADPEKYALTAKALLVGALPIATTIAGLACTTAGFCFDTSLFPQLVDAAYNLLVLILTIVSSVMGFIGLWRKLWLGRWAHPAATLG